MDIIYNCKGAVKGHYGTKQQPAGRMKSGMIIHFFPLLASTSIPLFFCSSFSSLLCRFFPFSLSSLLSSCSSSSPLILGLFSSFLQYLLSPPLLFFLSSLLPCYPPFLIVFFHNPLLSLPSPLSLFPLFLLYFVSFISRSLFLPSITSLLS